MDATIANKKLRGFVRLLKTRLENIQMDGRMCGKLVRRRRNGYGPLVWQRCWGDVDGNGCYNCDYKGPGFSCPHCQNNVSVAGAFCSSSCSGQYYAY